MKKLLLIFTLLVSTVMFSSPSYAEWTKVDEDKDGRKYYVDYERIRKHGGYVYFWTLTDFLKPMSGIFSTKTYKQGDCKLFRYKGLSYSFHKEPMGGGTGKTDNNPDKNWKYPSPKRGAEVILKFICSR